MPYYYDHTQKSVEHDDDQETGRANIAEILANLTDSEDEGIESDPAHPAE